MRKESISSTPLLLSGTDFSLLSWFLSFIASSNLVKYWFKPLGVDSEVTSALFRSPLLSFLKSESSTNGAVPSPQECSFEVPVSPEITIALLGNDDGNGRELGLSSLSSRSSSKKTKQKKMFLHNAHKE